METITAINSRRSIRKYQTTLMPHDDIEKIILAGMQAPSPKNRQPWRFIDKLKAVKNGWTYFD